MYKVIINELVDIKINNFINSYTKNSLKRFNDTWIFDEYIITKRYKDKSIELNNNIYLSIQNKLSEENIYWYRINENNETECIIFVWNYMIVLWYKEDKESKLRLLEHINFNKK